MFANKVRYIGKVQTDNTQNKSSLKHFGLHLLHQLKKQERKQTHKRTHESHFRSVNVCLLTVDWGLMLSSGLNENTSRGGARAGSLLLLTNRGVADGKVTK